MCNSESFCTTSQLTFVENIFHCLEASTHYFIKCWLYERIITMQVRFAVCVAVQCCSAVHVHSLCVSNFLKQIQFYLTWIQCGSLCVLSIVWFAYILHSSNAAQQHRGYAASTKYLSFMQVHSWTFWTTFS